MANKIEVRIGCYTFDVGLVDRKEIDNNDGRTNLNKSCLLIANDLGKSATILTARHEVIHALLGTQGRCYQKKFDVEEMCEFIAYRLPEINSIMERIERWLEDIKYGN